MAIAFDTQKSQEFTSSATTHTLSYTMGSVTNGILLVGVAQVGSSADDVTGATYNGGAMTLIGKISGTAIFTYLFYVLSPASGAHNIVVSLGTSRRIHINAVSLSGVVQTGIPIAFDTQTGTNSVTSDAITSKAGSWLVAMAHNNNFSQSFHSNKTDRNLVDGGTTSDASLFATSGPLTAGTVDITVDSNDGGSTSNIVVATLAAPQTFSPKVVVV